MDLSLDERRDYLPFFTYRLFNKPISADHGAFDSPHVVGRFLNALTHASRAFGTSVPTDLVERLGARLSASLSIGENQGDHLAWNEQTNAQVYGAVPHNQREALLGLLALDALTGSDRWLRDADRLVRGIATAVFATGDFPGSVLTPSGWVHDSKLAAPPAKAGRLIRALLAYHQRTGNQDVLPVARRIASEVVGTCFTPTGEWTDIAGPHIHSITGTITGLIDLGIALKDDDLVTSARQAFDVGLRPYRNEAGWVQEVRGSVHERGEANNSADVLESALLLGRSVDPSYYDVAERILRNHLLVSQFRDSAGFDECDGGEDTLDRTHRGVLDRAMGGFFFTSPADVKSHPGDIAPINTDLVGGAVEGICEAAAASIEDDGADVVVNILVSGKRDTVTVESRIPEEGMITVALSEPRRLRIRIPGSVDRNTLSLLINDRREPPHFVNHYLLVNDRPAAFRATVRFDLSRRVLTESINGKEYRSEWVGDTVESMSGPTRLFRELY